jgi:leader peptidase (prepilin peptidase)/N-methyltransferase
VSGLLIAACSVLGLVVGWLSDPVITRVPLRQSVLGPPAVDEPPAPRGRRVVVTIACGALAGATAARFDDSWALPAYLVLTLTLVILAVIDFETYLLPNRIVYPLTFVSLGLFAVGAAGDNDMTAYTRGLVAGAVAFGAFLLLHLIVPRGMGFGDVKLSFVLGLSLGYLGWGELFFGLFLGFFYGAVIGVFLIATRLRARNQQVPFGPFLAAGTITAILVGSAFLDWYTGK